MVVKTPTQTRLNSAYHQAGYAVAALALDLPVGELELEEKTPDLIHNYLTEVLMNRENPELDRDRTIAVMAATQARLRANQNSASSELSRFWKSFFRFCSQVDFRWDTEDDFTAIASGLDSAWKTSAELVQDQWPLIRAIAITLTKRGRLTPEYVGVMSMLPHDPLERSMYLLEWAHRCGVKTDNAQDIQAYLEEILNEPFLVAELTEKIDLNRSFER